MIISLSHRFAVKMGDSLLEEMETFLRKCKDLHALFNFTALSKLDENETSAVIPALLGNYTLCVNQQRTTETETRPTPTTLPQHYPPALTAFFVVIAIFGLAVNLCVIGTVCRVRRLWSITNAFVLSLAMADVFMASVLVPLNITYKYYYWLADISTAKDTLFPLLGVASLLNLTAVTLERFMSISYPLRYNAYLTRCRATIIVATVWFTSFFQAFLPFAIIVKSESSKVLYEDLRFAFVFALPFLCILMVNIKIYCVARTHARQIHASNPQGERGFNRAFIKKLKTVKIIALLVGTFTLTWLPYFVLSMYDHHSANKPPRVAWDVTEALVCSTALLNPLLYGLLRKDVREAMFRGIRCQNVNQTELQSFSYSFRTEHTAAMAAATKT